MVEEQDRIWRDTGNFDDIQLRSREGGLNGDLPREQRDWTLDVFAAALKVLEAPGTQNSKVLICGPARKNRSVRVVEA